MDIAMYKMIHNSYQNSEKKKLYRYIKSLQSDCSGIPSLQKNNETFAGCEDKANTYLKWLFLHYFLIEKMIIYLILKIRLPQYPPIAR